MATINILAKLPSDFFELLESSKWKDRKDALQKLLDELDAGGPRLSLDQKANYGELMSELKKIIWKDANVVVVTLGVRALSGIAKGLSTKFSKYIPMFMVILFEKFKEKKTTVREALTDCVDAIASTTHMDGFIESVVEVLEKKSTNPDVKANIDRWIYRTLLRYTPSDVPNGFIATVAPFVAQHLSDGDPDVRDAGCMACAGIMRLLGEKATTVLIKGWAEDKGRQKKITEFREKAVSEASEFMKSAQVEGMKEDGDLKQFGDDKENQGGVVGERAVAVDPWELMEEVEILAKLPNSFFTMVDSKQWKDRLSALEDLNGLLERNERLSSKEDYREVLAVLVKVLGKDVNVNVAAVTAKCIKGFARGIRYRFASQSPMVLATALLKFKEKKAVLREPLTELVDSIAIVTPLSLYVDVVDSAMQQSNPQVKAQTALFLARVLKQHSAETLPDDFKRLGPRINKLTSDSDTEVREASYAVIGAAMKSLGEREMNNLFADVVNDSIKMAKVKVQHAETLEESGRGPSDAILKMQKFAATETAAPDNMGKKQLQHGDTADVAKAAVLPKRLAQGHHARVVPRRAAPRAVIPSSASTPHIPGNTGYTRPAARGASPQPNAQAFRTPQKHAMPMPKKVTSYSFPPEMPSAAELRSNVAPMPSQRPVATPRGVEDHLARMARRRVVNSNKQQDDKDKEVGSNMRSPTLRLKSAPVRVVARNAPSSAVKTTAVNRPTTAPVSARGPFRSNQSDRNANVLGRSNAGHVHTVLSHRGSRLPLPSSARK
ncbi:unnamed protein product [Toxocara canis]|uniref:Cytoskeleton-associated protein 5 n=1 Tax=Toxocara canis TaxID=6265 RepID=A0A183UJI5_TOXCA|nr:unnamed protein product [Toxocara canis]